MIPVYSRFSLDSFHSIIIFWVIFMVVLVYQHRTNHENKTHNFNYNIVEKKCVIAVTKHRDAINNFNLNAFFACLKTGPGFLMSYVIVFFMFNVLGPWSYGSLIYNYLCNQCLSPLMCVSSNLNQGEVYNIMWSSDLRQVSGFLWVFRFPPPIKLTATI
jgi:hypothetical protein